MKTKRKFSAEFKAKVALKAVKGQMTLAELSTKYEINQNQICKWKQELLKNAGMAFTKERPEVAAEKREKELYPSLKTGSLHLQKQKRPTIPLPTAYSLNSRLNNSQTTSAPVQ